MKLIKNNKKILASFIFIFSILISSKALAQYPVSIEYIDPSVVASTTITQISPQVRFWVTNFESTTSSSTLFTKDETLIDVANKLFKEQERHNKWLEDYTKVGGQADKELARNLATQLLIQINNKTIDFAGEGFNKGVGDNATGDPAYVQDQQDFLKKADKTEVGILYKYGFESKDICKEVKTEVKKVIGKEAMIPDFQKQIKCTNKNDGEDPKSWEDWLQIVQPENNPMGALIIANSELEKRQQAKEDAIKNELNQGNGALSYKECQKIKINNKGEEENDGDPFYGDPIYEQDIPEDTTTTDLTSDDSTGGYIKTVCTVVKPGSITNSNTQAENNSALNTTETNVSQADGTNLIDEEMSQKLQERLDAEFSTGILNNENNDALDTLENDILENNAEQLSKVSTTSVNPFSPDDIYNTENKTSPYNQKNWFDKWGGGSAFDIVNIINGYSLIDYPPYVPSTSSECNFGKVKDSSGNCVYSNGGNNKNSGSNNSSSDSSSGGSNSSGDNNSSTSSTSTNNGGLNLGFPF